MRSMIRWISVGALAATLAGCKTESLSDFATSSVWASISASAKGGSTTVTATFSDGPASLTFLQLTSDDSVKATVGSNTQTLAENSLAGAVDYSNSFSVDTGQFTVALTRKKDNGAPSSVVTLPEPFTLGQAPSSASRAQALTLTWTSNPDPNPMQISITGTCINQFQTSVQADTNQVTIAANSIQKAPPPSNGQSVPDSCTATADFTRKAAGTLDPAYKGGDISATQEGSLSFTTTP